MPVAMVEPSKRMGVTYTLEHMASLAMAAICGGGGVYSYMQAKSMPTLIAGATLGSLYGISSYPYWIRSGRPLDGIDLSILASTLLVLAMGPRAYASRANIPMALTGLGALVMARMGYASYNLRHNVRGGGSHSI